MLRGTLDGPTTARVCDENLTIQRNLNHSAVGAVSARKYSPVLRTLAYAVLFLTKRYARFS